MNRLILLSVVVGSLMFAGTYGDSDIIKNQSNVEKYSWVSDSIEDASKNEAGRRRGKGHRGDRRRGPGGLR